MSLKIDHKNNDISKINGNNTTIDGIDPFAKENLTGVFPSGSIPASAIDTIKMDQVTNGAVNNPDFTTLLDWFDVTQSGGVIDGGEITDNGDGTVTVSAGNGIIRTVDSDIGEVAFVKWDTNVAVSAYYEDTTWIYVDYNNGSPIIGSTTDWHTINFTTQFLLGRCFRGVLGNHILHTRSDVTNTKHKLDQYIYEVYGPQRASGMILGETGTLNITVTPGVFYTTFVRHTTNTVNTSGSDRLIYWYRDGAGSWSPPITGQSAIDPDSYDDNSGTLASVGVGKFATHFLYILNDSHVNVVYGRDSYNTLAEAEISEIPSDIPPLLRDFGIFIGRIITTQGETSFTEVKNPFWTVLAFEAATSHLNLSDLQGGAAGEYFHLDATEFTNLDGIDQGVSTTDDVTFNSLSVTTGIDADTLDGLDSLAFATSGHDHDLDYADINHLHTWVYAPSGHIHDDRYYTESEVDTLLDGVSGGDLSGYVPASGGDFTGPVTMDTLSVTGSITLPQYNYETTAGASQTIYDLPWTYLSGELKVFVAGIRQPSTAFTETDSNTITLSEAPPSGAYVIIEK